MTNERFKSDFEQRFTGEGILKRERTEKVSTATQFAELVHASRALFTVVGEALIDAEVDEMTMANRVEAAHERLRKALEPFTHAFPEEGR